MRRSEKLGAGCALSPGQVASFRGVIYEFYQNFGRDLPWRRTKEPYHIFVAEIMLQQTQVERVVEKYGLFVSLFPDFRALAGAPLGDVLLAWQGMGYNRRALALIRAAQLVMSRYGGSLPARTEELLKLPGVGRATSSSILAFAFNIPVVFVETNIRRVFIHQFFEGRDAVDDSEIIPLVAETLDRSNPAVWYHALMDFGSMLKRAVPNPNRRSSHYRTQSPFPDSARQLRGRVLRLLLKESPLSYPEIEEKLDVPDDRLRKIMEDLHRDGFIRSHGGRYAIR